MLAHHRLIHAGVFWLEPLRVNNEYHIEEKTFSPNAVRQYEVKHAGVARAELGAVEMRGRRRTSRQIFQDDVIFNIHKCPCK